MGELSFSWPMVFFFAMYEMVFGLIESLTDVKYILWIFSLCKNSGISSMEIQVNQSADEFLTTLRQSLKRMQNIRQAEHTISLRFRSSSLTDLSKIDR